MLHVLCNAKVVIIFWVRDILVRTLLLINFLLVTLMPREFNKHVYNYEMPQLYWSKTVCIEVKTVIK